MCGKTGLQWAPHSVPTSACLHPKVVCKGCSAPTTQDAVTPGGLGRGKIMGHAMFSAGRVSRKELGAWTACAPTAWWSPTGTALEMEPDRSQKLSKPGNAEVTTVGGQFLHLRRGGSRLAGASWSGTLRIATGVRTARGTALGAEAILVSQCAKMLLARPPFGYCDSVWGKLEHSGRFRGVRVAGSRAAGSRAAGSRAAGSQAVGGRAVGSRAAGSRTAGSRAAGIAKRQQPRKRTKKT